MGAVHLAACARPAEGEYYAVLLCPLGYRREFHVVWGPVQRTDHYILDFALPDAKINIDGPYHNDTRDGTLRRLGWKVIRIRHD